MNATYLELDGRPALRFERRLAHPVEDVWSALTEPAALARWFPNEVEIELRPGGAMHFVFPGGEAPPMEGEVKQLDPPRLFEFSWGEDVLRFELSPEDDGAACVLRFTDYLGERDKAARDAAGWQVCFERLDESLDAGDAGGPETGVTSEWREYYDGYVAEGMPSGAEIPGQA
ncbi:MAG: SRPBCC family protein [Thermoleophilaceae bacterium]